MKLIKFLAFYTLVYITASFIFHSKQILYSRDFTPQQLTWLLIKVPVFTFCILALLHQDKA